MSIERLLPKDPIAAADILAALKTKDENEILCRYPTCDDVRQTATVTGGRPSTYCQNPKHNAVSNHRARAALRAATGGVSLEAIAKQEASLSRGGVAPAESLRASVVSGMLQLQTNLERYLSVLITIADPDLSAAQIQASLDQAEARIAEAHQAVSAERSLRLASDMIRQTAQAEARAEIEAAELAISAMEEAEARFQNQGEEIQKQAKKAIIEAQTAMMTAQEEAKQANTRAHDTDVDARAQVAAAERLLSEARAMLERERAEVDRLRSELIFARTQVEQENQRDEANRVEAHTALDRERGEVDRLRRDLAETRIQAEQATARADQLAITTDELRALLHPIQAEKKNRSSKGSTILAEGQH